LQQVITLEYRYIENCSNYLNVFRVPEPLCLPGRIGFCSTDALNSGAALNVAATRKCVTKLIAKREREFVGDFWFATTASVFRRAAWKYFTYSDAFLPDQQLPIPAQPIEHEARTYRISLEKC
jgi:hypothetical protein